MTKNKKSKIAKYEIIEMNTPKKEVKIIKKGPETPQQMNNRRRAELYDLAEQCRAAGDMDGYRGYMSAVGDVGR